MAVPAAVNVEAAYDARLVAVRTRVAGAVDAQWQRLDSWRDADIKRFARAVVPLVEGGQRQVATLTDAYLAQFEATALGRNVRPVGVKPKVVTNAAIRGVPTVDVYYRAGPTVWAALAKGLKLDAAVAKARARMAATVAADLQLAKTHAARAVLMSKGNVTGFQRVTHGTCPLCAGTADQIYGIEQVLPIHPNCNCGVAPVFEGRAPIRPSVLDSDLAGIAAVAVAVVAHGELGPLLVNADEKHTRLGDIDDDEDEEPPPKRKRRR